MRWQQRQQQLGQHVLLKPHQQQQQQQRRLVGHQRNGVQENGQVRVGRGPDAVRRLRDHHHGRGSSVS